MADAVMADAVMPDAPLAGDAQVRAHVGRAGPVLVLFTAAWCRPCRRAQSEARALAGHAGAPPLLIAELDRAQDAALAADLRGVPSLVLYRDGGQAAVKLGAYAAPQWAAWVREQLADGEGAGDDSAA
jgi:thioredoxin 1